MHIAMACHMADLPAVQHSCATYRDPQPNAAHKHLFHSKLTGGEHLRRQRIRIFPKRPDILRYDSQIGGNAGPNAAGVCRLSKLSKIKCSGFKDGVGIYDIAYANVEMAIHTLKSSSDNSLFRRRRHERIPVDMLRNAPRTKPPGQCDMLSCLSQAAVVYLHRFLKPLHPEIALVGQPVTPGATFWPGCDSLAHHAADFLLIARCVQVKVIAQVRPMVKRFHDRDLN